MWNLPWPTSVVRMALARWESVCTFAAMSKTRDMKLLQANSVLERFRNATYKLDNMVRGLQLAKDAQGLPRIVALASVVGNVLDVLLPSNDTLELLAELGWVRAARHSGVLKLVRKLLEAQCAPERIRVPSTYHGEQPATLSVWYEEGEPVVVIARLYNEDTLLEKRPGTVARLLGEAWSDAPAWAVEVTRSLTGDDRYELVPLREVEAPVGPQAEELRRWLKRPSTGTRVVLIVGPTGAGKTTLARTALGEVRTLQIPANLGHRAALELAALMRPGVLLLDDLVLGEGLDAGFAALLDRLHGHVPLVLATLMDDSLTAESARRPGALYWPGMRAGRLDRVVFLAPPELAARKAILAHYGLVSNEVAELSAGLTGAFLQELARRIREEPGTVAEHVAQLRAQAPASFTRAALESPETALTELFEKRGA